jgi:hypothetical protein
VVHGRVRLELSCPAGQTVCRGTLLLKTLKPVAARGAHGKPGRAQAMVLGRVSFAIRGGHSRSVSIHLSRAAIALLGRSRLLWTSVTINAHNPQGERYRSKFRLALEPDVRR